ncbi:MAG: hypothetical protein AAGU16_07635 [Desulfitobacterium hafniense]
MIRLADQDELREALAANALAHASSQSWNTIFDRLLRDYRFVLDKYSDTVQTA